MQLHIFNPEHDMALALDMEKFVPSHAGREMRADLGFLPALWAEDGDWVLVDDVEGAKARIRHLGAYAHDVHFITCDALGHHPSFLHIQPWGWNRALRRQLLDAGINEAQLPSHDVLSNIRQMSHRFWAATHLLKPLVAGDTSNRVGLAHQVSDAEELEVLIATLDKCVLKAPWSSSGRGLRYVEQLTTHQRGWARNIIAKQRSVMVEPYFHKVMDFACEFEVKGNEVRYCGLSIFRTVNGMYAGNVIATEQEKEDMVSEFFPFVKVRAAINDLLQLFTENLAGIYEGPLGVDMMLVNTENATKLHPCVEVNLRRTMGHVALAFNPSPCMPRRLMQVGRESGTYHLRLLTTAENCLPSYW